jgi:hypothetical protein
MRKKFPFAWCGIALLATFSHQNAVAKVPKQKTGTGYQATVLQNLRAEDIANFSSALQALSRTGRVDCIAEASPKVSRLSAKEASLILKEATSFQVLAEKVASAYDYDLSRSGNILRFLKRYSDPGDLPNVTYQEAIAAMQDTLYAFSGVVPTVERRPDGQHPLLFALSSTLSEKELGAMAQGLPIATLTPEKQSAVWNIALFAKYGSVLGGLSQRLAWAKEIKRQDVLFGFADENKPQSIEFALSVRHSSNGPRSIQHTPASCIDGSPFVRFDGIVQNEVNETELKLRKEAKKDTTPRGTITLREAIVLLNRSSLNKTTFTVDERLASNTITLVNGGFSRPEDQLKAIAFIYDLDARVGKDGTLLLTRKSPHPVKDASDIAEAVKRVMPASVLRALNASGQRLQDKEERAARKSDPLYAESLPLANRTKQGAKEIREAALYELTLSLEAELHTAPDKRVAFSKLTGKSRDTIGLLLLLNTVPRLYDSCVVEPVPAYISRLDSLFLTGGIITNQSGAQSFSVDIGQKLESGKIVKMTGVGPGLYLP